jgi:transposase
MANINLPFDIDSLEITNQRIDDKGDIIIDVVSTCTDTKCHKCGKTARKRYGYSPIITVQHTAILDRRVYLKIKPIRYECEYCDDHTTTTEQYDWCARNAKVSNALEKYLMRSLINSTVEDVSRKENVPYKTIIRALNRQVETTVDWSQYTDLHVMGIDEISDKKGHQDYLTIISTKSKSDGLSVIAVLKDRDKDTVKKFLDSIPKHLQKTVTSVCTDMHDGFVYAAIEVFGQQAVVVDRYHVAKLYRKPLDKLRIKEMARLKKELSSKKYAKLEGMMWILRKQHECLTEADKDKLQLLYKYSPLLKKAHSYALRLTHILNTHSNRKRGMEKINRWISMVEKSDLKIFETFIKTLTKYKSSIANYFKGRKNSGFVEGLNNKIKVIKRRCYGFSKIESYFQRLFLDLKGYAVYGF